MTRRSLAVYALLLSAVAARGGELLDCADPRYGWTGTSGDDGSDGAPAIAVDSDGNTVLVGGISGTMDLDPTDGEDFWTASAFGDAYVTKLGPDGSYQWSILISGDSYEGANAVAIDSQGNILVGGWFQGTVDFDPGSGEVLRTSQAYIDGYVAKLDPDGALHWVWTFGSGLFSFASTYAESLSVDVSDNVLVTGVFGDSVDFDPTDSEDVHESSGGFDVFVTKLTSGGGYTWTRTLGGDKGDVGRSVATDGEGNVIIAGVFGEMSSAGYMIDFDPTEDEDWHTGQGSGDLFVTKLHGDGSYAWTATMGGASEQVGHDVGLDAEGNIVVTGYFRDTVDFDPTEGEDWRTSVTLPICGCPSHDIFVTKLGADGSYRWTATMGGQGDDEAAALAVDASGDVIIAGVFSEMVDFDPTDGSDIHYGGFGHTDGFVTVLGGDGSYGWTETIGGDQSDAGDVLALDPYGDIVVGGTFEGTVDFDPTDGVDEHTAVQFSDYFVTKLLCSDPPPCEGDANNDWSVDPLDAGFVLARLGCIVGAGDADCDIADMNGDGLVDPLDAGFILARFGTCG